MQYRIKRSARRRTVSLEIRDAQLLVRAPVGVSERDLERFVRQKSLWIDRKISAQRALLARVPEYRYVSGTCLPFMGEELTLAVAEGAAGRVERLGSVLSVATSRRSRRPAEEQARALVEGWYRAQSRERLTEKTRALSRRMGLECTAVTIRRTKSKWGHCTSRGEIQYNWQILLAPEPVVDYLVAHEVCHLRHHNHSRAFWHLVEQVCPDYRRQRDWLKANGRCLVL
ncbi:M48 family metallopeptidase [Marinimicrobium agarilyticum]|uniref:M48 family metallopeptidase n=1 Tax=Marinimicrobium agarilyticum TaxID=306546 RepID=UPI000427C2FC|nr:SprT family zinc-dependent metalloprotease [Marinimicrobium agarilyticum]